VEFIYTFVSRDDTLSLVTIADRMAAYRRLDRHSVCLCEGALRKGARESSMSPGRESAADLEAKVLEAVLAQAVSA
jgi:hypothetical protein